MFETSSDDLLPSHHDEELVDNLLSNEDSEDGMSLAKALLPLVESSSSSSSSCSSSSPLLIPWVCSTRYKTELCTSYSSSGACRYAERCQFAHGLHELHVPSRHPKYKTELCRGYHTTGYCFYGNRCLYAHSPGERRPVQRRRRRDVACRTFRAFGVCPFGTRCNFLHVEGGDANGLDSPGGVAVDDEEKPAASSPQLHPPEWRPRGELCRTFSAFGFCLYGTRCRFQHSKMKDDASSSSSPGSSGFSSPGATPPADAHNAFTFSSRHLSDLLLTFHLQQLESSKASWDNRAL